MKHNQALRFLSLLLALTLFLCACGSGAPAQAEEKPANWVMNFPGTQWGMTPEEVVAALALPEGSYELVQTEIGKSLQTRLTLFGSENALTGFSFNDQNGDGSYSLYAITVYYPQNTDMEAVRAAMTELYGEPAETEETDALWNSQALQQDIMTQAEAEFLAAQGTIARKNLTEPATRVSWTTNAFPVYQVDGEDALNRLSYSSSVGFLTKEGGYTSHMEKAGQ